ncbi:MAG: hypothetical protein AABX28_02705 [Nanoarchaeota archaeon]
MANEMRFFVPEENYEEVKKVIRGTETLRFDYNPFKLDGRYQISISGNLGDLKIVSDYLSLIEKPKVEKKRGFLERLVNAFWLG